MENNISKEKPPKQLDWYWILMFILWGLLVSLTFLIFPPLGNNKKVGMNYLPKPLSTQTSVTLKEMMVIGKQDNEHESLLSEIRNDLKIPPVLEIKIFIGPYSKISGEGQLVTSNHPFGFILLLDEIFYQELSPEEKIALISHELGHLTNDEIFTSYNTDAIIQFQIEADTYATKYARPEAMMAVLSKADYKHGRFSSRQLYLRIQNLEKIRKDRQAQ